MPLTDIASLRAALATRAGAAASGTDPNATAFAAVATIVRPVRTLRGDDAEVLLIRRAELDGDPWSGHMAFPGGRKNAQDPDLLATAVRETREEIGLHLDSAAELLGPLAPLPALARGKPLGMTVAPFVFVLREPAELLLNHEVAEVLWAPLGPMLDGSLATHQEYVWQGQKLTLPAYAIEGRVVWGLTYQMLQTLFSLVTARPR